MKPHTTGSTTVKTPKNVSVTVYIMEAVEVWRFSDGTNQLIQLSDLSNDAKTTLNTEMYNLYGINPISGPTVKYNCYLYSLCCCLAFLCMPGLTAKASQDRLAQGTVTFKNPISIDALNSILKESNARLKDGEIKFINEKGEWITVNARNINQSTIERVIDEIIKSGLAKKLTYEGITSARIFIDLYDDSYETMSANDNVFLVDMMDEIVKHEHDDFEGEIKVRVFDLAWALKDLK